MWEILPNMADWDCFKTLTSREILKIQNPLLEEHFAFFGSHTFVPTSWMCKKQTAVSHTSTESEIISLDTGLRLDGLLALELWDLIVSVLGNISRISDRTVQPPHDDILEGLYKLRIRGSEKLKTVLELYDLETHQKK